MESVNKLRVMWQERHDHIETYALWGIYLLAWANLYLKHGG